MEGHKGFKEAIIKLDSPRCVFYPGQTITGTLEVEVDSPLTFSVIYIKFIGEATVGWTEQESESVNGQQRYFNVEYSSREEYLRASELLAGSYGTVSHLNAGKYSYPFRSQLPMALPSSFKGSRGAVKFYASGHVEFEGKNLFDGGILKPFDVVAPFDLNQGNAAVREPIELEFEEVFSCGCFGGEPVSVVVRVPFSAYCPGQLIPVAVRVNNGSSVEITSMLFELLTRSRYKSQRPIAEYVQPEELMSSAKRGSIMSGSQRNFEVELRVPDLIAPNLELCSVIDVGYFIRVTIKVSGCNADLQDEAELCLGLVPLKETVEGTYSHPMAHSLPLEAPPENYQPDAKQNYQPDAKQNYQSDAKQNYQSDAKQNYQSDGQNGAGNPNGTSFFQQVTITPSSQSIQIKQVEQTSYQIGFSTSATNSPGNTGQFPNPYGILMQCFTPPGVYPTSGQNNASTAPSAPPL